MLSNLMKRMREIKRYLARMLMMLKTMTPTLINPKINQRGLSNYL
jgi:hypothetical protein